jgi:hypothetical protein
MLVILGKLAWCMLRIYILSCTPKETTDYKPIVIELHIFQQTLPKLCKATLVLCEGNIFLKYNAEEFPSNILSTVNIRKILDTLL